MNETPFRTYYDTLGVDPRATDEEIREAYRTLIAMLHPDRFDPVTQRKQWEKANDVLRQIIEAYGILSEPRSRSEYNQRVGITPTPSPSDEEVHSGASQGEPKQANTSPHQPSPTPATESEVLAGFWLRLAAYFVDVPILLSLLFLAYYGVRFTSLVSLERLDMDFVRHTPTVYIATMILYSSTCLALKARTVGMAILGLRVRRIDGSHIGWKTAFWRCIMFVFPSQLFFGIGCWPIGFHKRNQGWHDIVARTVVTSYRVRIWRELLAIPMVIAGILLWVVGMTSIPDELSKPLPVHSPPVVQRHWWDKYERNGSLREPG